MSRHDDLLRQLDGVVFLVEAVRFRETYDLHAYATEQEARQAAEQMAEAEGPRGYADFAVYRVPLGGDSAEHLDWYSYQPKPRTDLPVLRKRIYPKRDWNGPGAMHRVPIDCLTPRDLRPDQPLTDVQTSRYVAAYWPEPPAAAPKTLADINIGLEIGCQCPEWADIEYIEIPGGTS